MNRGDGRPLRFLAVVGCCWIGVRVALVLTASGSASDAMRTIAPVPRQVAVTGVRDTWPSGAQLLATVENEAVRQMRRTMSIASRTTAFVGVALTPTKPAPGMGEVPPEPTAPSFATNAPLQSDPVPILPVARVGGSRLAVSSWLIARGGTGLGASGLSPQLGGTQGGLRIDYALGRGVAATGRIAAPAVGTGREVSVGIAWRPSGVPLRFVAEQRVALDRGRGGPGLGVSTGVSSVRLPAGVLLDGYAQVGAIARAGIERYADASVRAARPIGDMGGIAFDLGAGAWGGAQRGAARLDVGPSIGARVPLAGQTLRVSIDWRQRIAGDARPGSGPALTFGSDF